MPLPATNIQLEINGRTASSLCPQSHPPSNRSRAIGTSTLLPPSSDAPIAKSLWGPRWSGRCPARLPGTEALAGFLAARSTVFAYLKLRLRSAWALLRKFALISASSMPATMRFSISIRPATIVCRTSSARLE